MTVGAGSGGADGGREEEEEEEARMEQLCPNGGWREWRRRSWVGARVILGGA